MALLLVPQLCAAQDAASSQVSRQNEKDLRESCAMTGSADICTQWTAVASCVMNYRENLPEIAKLQSNEDLQKFRINAAKNLPKACTGIAKILLQIDILNGDLALPKPQLSKSEREKRWQSIFDMSKSADIIAQQRQLIAHEFINAPDFQEMMKLPKVKQYITSASDEAFTLLPEISDDTTSFLSQLHTFDPNAVTMRGSIVMAMLDLRNGRYLSAKNHLLDIDTSKLSEAEISKFAPEIKKNGIHLIKQDDFINAVCLPEIDRSVKNTRTMWLYQLMMDKDSESAVYILRGTSGLYLRNCEFERVCTLSASIWSTRYTNGDVQAYFNDLVKYIEAHPEPALVQTFVKSMSAMSGEALEALKSRYGTRISKIVLNQARYDIASKAYTNAQDLLSGALRLVPDAGSCDLRLQYGRALHLDNKRIPARQQWSYIIEHGERNLCREIAFTLAIQSLQKDGKKAEAEALEKQREQ